MQSQLYVPPLSKTNNFLIILSVVIYFADIAFTYATERTLTSILGLSWNGFSSGLIFQLVTFPFVSDSFFSVLFNGLCLWFIGSDLETTWGSRFYQRFLLAMVLFTGIIYLSFVALFFAGLVSLSLIGMTGITFALLVAYSMVNSDRYLSFMMLFPMKAKYFCLLLGAVELYQIVFSPYGKSSWAHLFSMGFAMIYLMYFSAKARGAKIFNFGKNKKRTAKRGKLKLVDPNDVEQEKPKYWN